MYQQCLAFQTFVPRSLISPRGKSQSHLRKDVYEFHRCNNSGITELNAKKNQKGSPVEKTSERESKSLMELVIVYMTPWRNPNSIFVYMFMILYALGKVSEARHFESLQ